MCYRFGPALACLWLASIALGFTSPSVAAERPNIIVILADDK